MKRFFLTVIVAVSAAIMGFAENSLFKACEDIPGVSSSYIGKAMLRHAVPALIGHGVSGQSLNAGLEEVTIIEAETPASVEQVKKQLKSYEKSQKFELIMKSKDEGELTRIMQGKSPDGKYEFLLVTEEKDEVTIVILSSSQSFDNLNGIFMPNIVK